MYYFYWTDGKLVAKLTPQFTDSTNNPSMTMNGPTTTRTYFGSRLSGTEDRIGSRGKYYPYGEDRGSTPAAGQVGFATYIRDGASWYYANQRYFSNGRFQTPDPSMARGAPPNPQRWNPYAYALNDPVRFH